MNYNKFWLVAVSAFLLMGFIQAEPFAEVLKVKGQPYVMRKDKADFIKKGSSIEKGEVVITEAGGFAKIQIIGGHKVFIFSKSRVSVGGAKGKIRIDHKLGDIWVKVNKLNKEESFKVKTPSAVAGVRGTSFNVCVEESGETGVCVCEGQVEVESGGKKLLLKKGQGSKLGKGMAPGKAYSNSRLIKNHRRMKKLGKNCISCHSNGAGNTSDYD